MSRSTSEEKWIEAIHIYRLWCGGMKQDESEEAIRNIRELTNEIILDMCLCSGISPEDLDL